MDQYSSLPIIKTNVKSNTFFCKIYSTFNIDLIYKILFVKILQDTLLEQKHNNSNFDCLNKWPHKCKQKN